MTSKPNVIEISSDSSGLMSPKPDWNFPYPPTGSFHKRIPPKGKVVDSSSDDFSSFNSSFFNDSLVSSYHSTSEDEAVSKKATMSKNPPPVHTLSIPGKREQVLCLPNQATREEIQAKKRKGKGPIELTKGKGKRTIS